MTENEMIDRLTAERDSLRKALIDVIRYGTDGAAACDVSTEFLLLVPGECASIKRQRDDAIALARRLAVALDATLHEDRAVSWSLVRNALIEARVAGLLSESR